MIFYEEIFRDFQKHKVKYVLVGGIALNLHGSLRNTADLDILVEMSNENLAKIVKILKKRGYRVRQPIDPLRIADPRLRKNWIRNKRMKAFNFYLDHELKEVDLIIDSPVTYEEARKRASRIRVGTLSLPLISIDHLIQMKRRAGRAIDRLDIADLKRIKKLGGRK